MRCPPPALRGLVAGVSRGAGAFPAGRARSEAALRGSGSWTARTLETVREHQDRSPSQDVFWTFPGNGLLGNYGGDPERDANILYWK